MIIIIYYLRQVIVCIIDIVLNYCHVFRPLLAYRNDALGQGNKLSKAAGSTTAGETTPLISFEPSCNKSFKTF